MQFEFFKGFLLNRMKLSGLLGVLYEIKEKRVERDHGHPSVRVFLIFALRHDFTSFVCPSVFFGLVL